MTESAQALEAVNAESTGKTYIDPESAEIIIEMIADLKRKTALAEEQLLILKQENTV